MVAIEPFRFDPDACVSERAIGASDAPLLVIDKVFADPAAARTAALRPGPAEAHAGDFYPGLRHPLPDSVGQSLADWLNGLAARPDRPALLSGQRLLAQEKCFVSVVTTPASALLPIQTIPHFDSPDEQIFAAVIYLFEAGAEKGFGGTSFYRHRSTGLEQLSRQSEALYRAALRREVADPAALPRRYRDGADALFEPIHRQEPRFNRMLLYPGRLLHAGDIPSDYAGASGVEDGRLTITTLFRLVPTAAIFSGTSP